MVKLVVLSCTEVQGDLVGYFEGIMIIHKETKSYYQSKGPFWVFLCVNVNQLSMYDRA